MIHVKHTHTLNSLCPGLPWWAGNRKVKPIWILLKRMQVCTSHQTTTPAPHHSVFYRLGALPAVQPTASKHLRHHINNSWLIHTHTHTHTHLTALCLGLPRWAGTRKVKPIWILLKQETVSGSGISWAIAYASAYRARQTTMPTPHRPPLSILQAGCPSCCPTNSGKALNAHVNQSCSSILSTLCLQQWTDGLDIH